MSYYVKVSIHHHRDDRWSFKTVLYQEKVAPVIFEQVAPTGKKGLKNFLRTLDEDGASVPSQFKGVMCLTSSEGTFPLSEVAGMIKVASKHRLILNWLV